MNKQAIEKLYSEQNKEIEDLKNQIGEVRKDLSAYKAEDKKILEITVNELVNNPELNSKINALVDNRVSAKTPVIVTDRMNLKLSDYLTTDKFNEYKKNTSKYLIDREKVDNNFNIIYKRLKAVEEREPKHISFFKLNRISNNYYKDEAEKKLFEKYGWWLKYKKDILWGFVVLMIVMTSLIAIQWLQINNLNERLNTAKEKIEIPIGDNKV